MGGVFVVRSQPVLDLDIGQFFEKLLSLMRVKKGGNVFSLGSSGPNLGVKVVFQVSPEAVGSPKSGSVSYSI